MANSIVFAAIFTRSFLASAQPFLPIFSHPQTCPKGFPQPCKPRFWEASACLREKGRSVCTKAKQLQPEKFVLSDASGGKKVKCFEDPNM